MRERIYKHDIEEKSKKRRTIDDDIFDIDGDGLPVIEPLDETGGGDPPEDPC